MANPWWILGGLYAWDRLNRNSREAQKNARRLAELEKIVHGEQPVPPTPVTAHAGADSDGCLNCLAGCGCLLALGVMAVVMLAIGWMVFG